jgi:hypothetical protein
LVKKKKKKEQGTKRSILSPLNFFLPFQRAGSGFSFPSQKRFF